MDRMGRLRVVLIAAVAVASPAAFASGSAESPGKSAPPKSSRGGQGKSDPPKSSRGGQGKSDPPKSSSGGQGKSDPPKSSAGGQGKSSPRKADTGRPGPAASLAAKAKAYGRYCRNQTKRHVAGRKGTPFSRCLTAMAKLATGRVDSSWAACAALRIPGGTVSPFVRCVVSGQKLLRDLHEP